MPRRRLPHPYVLGQGWARCCQELGFEGHGPRHHPHSKNPTGDRFVVPTLAKNARMGQPQFVVVHGAVSPASSRPPAQNRRHPLQWAASAIICARAWPLRCWLVTQSSSIYQEQSWVKIVLFRLQPMPGREATSSSAGSVVSRSGRCRHSALAGSVIPCRLVRSKGQILRWGRQVSFLKSCQGRDC